MAEEIRADIVANVLQVVAVEGDLIAVVEQLVE